MEKECSKCGEMKKFEEYGKAKANKDGMCGQCISCVKEIKRLYRLDSKDKTKKYLKANRTKITDRSSVYYQENKDVMNSNSKFWAKNNKGKISKYSKKYYTDNKDKVLSDCKDYKMKNKGIINSISSKYRSVRYRALSPNTNMDVIKQLYIDCGYQQHVDHIIPLQGQLPDGRRVLGAHTISNLQILSASDNMAKGNKISYEELEGKIEGVDYLMVPDDYFKEINSDKYKDIGFDVKMVK